jgi:hypothetical protein
MGTLWVMSFGSKFDFDHRVKAMSWILLNKSAFSSDKHDRSKRSAVAPAELETMDIQ